MDNKMILQSYKLTTIRDNYGLYAQRLLVELARQMQYRIENVKFTDSTTWNIAREQLLFKVNVKNLMPECDWNNKKYVKKCLKDAMSANVDFDYITEKGKRAWKCIVLFETIDWIDNTDVADVQITKSMWDLFSEFSKGFRKYELDCAMKLKSTYALRLYQLISEVERPIEYTIEDLRAMFSIPKNKYVRTYNFIQKVIESAKEELDEKAHYTFTYKPIVGEKTGKGRPSVEKIRFFPKRNKNIQESGQTDKELIRKYANVNVLSRECNDILTHKYNFSKQELKNNIELLIKAQEYMYDFTEWLTEKAPDALRKKNPKGYIIQAIRMEMIE